MLAADVSTAAGRASLLNAVDTEFGGCLDILVNNVGTNIRKVPSHNSLGIARANADRGKLSVYVTEHTLMERSCLFLPAEI